MDAVLDCVVPLVGMTFLAWFFLSALWGVGRRRAPMWLPPAGEPEVIGASEDMCSFLVRARTSRAILPRTPYTSLPYGTVISRVGDGLFQVDVMTTGAQRPAPVRWFKAHGTVDARASVGEPAIEVWRSEEALNV